MNTASVRIRFCDKDKAGVDQYFDVIPGTRAHLILTFRLGSQERSFRIGENTEENRALAAAKFNEFLVAVGGLQEIETKHEAVQADLAQYWRSWDDNL